MSPMKKTLDVPGVEGWHRSGGRIFFRLSGGTHMTVQGHLTPDELHDEARKLRFKADVLDAWASRKEE